jgi:predicted small metal-binding protein
MKQEVRCEDLGLTGCDFTARALTPGEVIDQVAGHLKSRHDIHLPPTTAIMQGIVDEDAQPKSVQLIITRLRDLLQLSEVDHPPEPEPLMTTPPANVPPR